MVHHGQSIFSIAKTKGFNKSSLARMLSKTPQAVDYDVKRAVLDKEVLESYAKILGVPSEEFQKNLKEISSNEDKSLQERYLDVLEENRKLWRVLMSNGLTIDLGKLDVIRLPRVSSLYFFGFTNISNNICE
ncbi:hypothetical protein GCM10011514_17030 [Emticicia aquatilis]|uniref:Uncharacterized protein n=1 Tax=Emticicia aquatilis TaxID=1537369 RepID=A0A917DNB5_9BACT|nr:hypothetical protein [Emticicia aquatilis]GGD53485.1 hypothetical protein GCM10011514_17030 [Emticicia aquatilis]